MGSDHHHPRSPSTDFYNILGISNVCKAYKSLVTKWYPDRSPSNKYEEEGKFRDLDKAYKAAVSKRQEEKFRENDDSLKGNGFVRRQSVDDGFLSRRPSLLSRASSRRSHTPSARPTSLSRNSSRANGGSSSTRHGSSLSKILSRRGTSSSEAEIPVISRTMSRNTRSPLSRTMTRRSPSEAETPEVSRSKSRRSTSVTEMPTLSRNMSRRSTTPIIFSQSTARRKPPPVEKKLECTLEELCQGSVKTIKITRDVLSDEGLFVEEEEVLKIILKPGWKKGTKVTFEGKGDEKPGFLPADIIFLIEEKKHPLFKRQGDDLLIAVEIPLLKALTGCSLSVPLLGGQKMGFSIDDVIYPGCEKVIRGQGMPIYREEGKRGDLRITFFINFPTDLSEEQRSEARRILEECS